MDAITSLFESLDFGKLLPEAGSLLEIVASFIKTAILLGPVIILFLGLIYLLLPPKEANHRFGFRTFFGMGSVSAWRFTQRIAGMVWTALGLILTVVMLFLRSGLLKMDPMEMLPVAIKYLLWQAGLTLVSYIGISIVVAVFFDYKGNLRRKRSSEYKKTPRK